MTPDPGSLTVFQSSRVARPQDASEALYLGSLLSCSARSFLDAYKQRMLRPVSEVSYMETRLGPAGQYVDPVFHSRRHYVGFVGYLVKALAVGFIEDAVEHVGLFFFAKKAGCERFILDARASNRLFLEPSIWIVAHRRGTLPCRISSNA